MEGRQTASDRARSMTAEIQTAITGGLRCGDAGTDQYFCGHGPRLELDDSPNIDLAPDHAPGRYPAHHQGQAS